MLHSLSEINSSQNFNFLEIYILAAGLEIQQEKNTMSIRNKNSQKLCTAIGKVSTTNKTDEIARPEIQEQISGLVSSEIWIIKQNTP